ncbi:DUF2878 domain-containing protein [Shewanella sp. NIFS-20-20]|uniref:DUF2878 domain-containing protein n=1 Tax=Shewanella sp. NIFS-20-20 TaxID=2853806 RepID=UPI001C4393C9|nr:DUF2878 domain-containing protein [Shewanella sp. NIFS-20-20]MBV7314513.1 DUF2878 domain-containing protein [Shewanella sp. NIFS-20-20]
MEHRQRLAPSPTRSMMLVDLVRFQVAWWSLVLLGQSGLVIGVILLLIQFRLSQRRVADGIVMAAIAMPGVLMDAMASYFGLFEFAGLPVWLALLWCHFGLSCQYSLRPVLGLNAWWVLVIGALGGSASYWAGVQLGAVSSSLSGPELVMYLMPLWAGVFIYAKTIIETQAMMPAETH